MTHAYRFSLVSLAALGIAMPAMAQEQVAPVADQAAPRERETIIVTANKREESVQDIAVAITAVSSEDRQELGIATITDLTNITPGLSYTAGNERVTLRGIGRNTNNFGAEPGVANYTDGIYQSFASIAGRDDIFVDRIEVLRGPQGTLYGRNSIGGALNVISKRPTDDFQAEMRIGVGNYDYRKIGASISGPVTDWLRYRVVGLREARDEGVYDNYATGKSEGYNLDNYYVEGQLEGDIGDRLSWWAKYTTGRYHNAGPPGGRTTPNSNAPYDVNSFGSLAATGAVTPNPVWAFGTSPVLRGFTMCGNTTTNPAVTDPRAVNQCGARVANLDAYDDTALEVIYEAPGFDIKYVGGYIYYNYNLTDDQDATPVQSISYLGNAAYAPSPTGTLKTIFPEQTLLYNENRAFFSNEFNFISTHDGPFQWIAGLYAYQENFKQPVKTFFKNEPLASASANPLLGGLTFTNPTFTAFTPGYAPNPERLLSYTNNIGLNNSYGAYFQGDYTFLEDWKATVGIRYSLDDKHIEEEARLFCYIQCGTTYADITQAIYNGRAAGFQNPGDRPQPGVTTATTANPTGITYNTATGVSSRLLEDQWDAVTGTAGLEWSPTPDTLLFGKYSRGYKTGGFNATDMAPLPRTKEEVVNAYEAGWKQEWRDAFLTTNLAVFFYDYQDVQIPIGVQPDVGPTYTAFTNIPKVETSGLELETNWNPIEPLNIRFTYAYLNAEIKESGRYVNSLCVPPAAGQTAGNLPGCPFGAVTATNLPGQFVEGNVLPQSPKHKVAANASYRIDFEDGASLMPSVSWYWRDEFTTSIFNNDQTFTSDFQQTDARLIWNSADSAWTAIGFVRNLFDEEGYDATTAFRRRSTNPAENNKIYTTDTLTLPRMYGFELQYHFR